jgi:serine protease Do
MMPHPPWFDQGNAVEAAAFHAAAEKQNFPRPLPHAPQLRATLLLSRAGTNEGLDEDDLPMRSRCVRVVLMAAALLAARGAGTEAIAQYSRRTPVVEAVEKTRTGIVTIKVEKKDPSGRNKESVGTGIIVDDRGYVVTNQHVIASAHAVGVQLSDGTELPARVVAEEARWDLAILRISTKKPLQALTLGPGTDLLVGESVIAVGHPFGFTNTVSTGIISALGREVTLSEKLTNLIQTNASINPGNSGGPLLNINGEVIGINVAFRDGAQGIAFAINVENVKQWLSRHLSALKVAGVYHGLTCSESVLPEGQRRQRIVLREAAQGTGLKPGDEIVRVADHLVSNRFDLERALWDRKPGDQVELTVLRGGQELHVPLTLSPVPEGKRITTRPAEKAPGTDSSARPASGRPGAR